MKPGPVIAMVVLLLVGVWLVLQPTLRKFKRIDPEAARIELSLGAARIGVEQRASGAGGFEYHFVGDRDLEALAWIDDGRFQAIVNDRMRSWQSRPAMERTLLGFFNISSWGNFVWIVVGLTGQACFFGRMLVQWVVSEKSRRSVVPAVFWWMSFFGGVALFAYFVWRTDIVGVLGQSTGVVIYARNLRLIHKHNRRVRRDESKSRESATAPEPVAAQQ
ncbi:MAG TPA: lipid-A-disaccharide synthase N-terminal domain-containing protein [Phycisphaerales bacterium]|nr:lipid-A-disaccharide synthase N-terminal domain-containing protein [Phycisphaerales bacterium]